MNVLEILGAITLFCLLLVAIMWSLGWLKVDRIDEEDQ